MRRESPGLFEPPTLAAVECDVAVVGAGPAGAVAALRLARKGVRTVLLEREPWPRYKTCGGGLVERARRKLEVDLGPALERSCELLELSIGRSGRRYEVSRAGGIVHMGMRAELDRRLVEAAVEAGAELRAGCAFEGLEPGPDRVRIATSRGPLVARAVIAADGARSRVARAAGWAENPHQAPALEAEVQVDAASFERLARSARFDLDVPRGGYAWVFPKREHLSIGVVHMRRGGAGLKGALESYLTDLSIERVTSIERHGWSIPIAPRPGGLARAGVLLAGDAAGLADPLTGEGIGTALESGRLAAEALLDAQLDPARAAALYAERAGATLLAELRAGRWLARLLYRQPRLRDLAFALHGATLAEAMTDTVCGERSYVSLLRSPRSWLRLARPARPAAIEARTRAGIR